MRKIIILMVALLIVSCKPFIQVKPLDSILPCGYNKAYSIKATANRISTESMKEYLSSFILDDDFVITINTHEHIILRK